MKDDYLRRLNEELTKNNVKNKDEILEKYKKRYEFGLESGLDEKTIEDMLKSPEEIAEKYKNTKYKKEKYNKNYNLLIRTVNDIVNIKESRDDKIHIIFDSKDYDNYVVKDNHEGLVIDYPKSQYFSLNRKKPEEILVELPKNLIFDSSEISSAAGDINISFIQSNKICIYTTSGDINIYNAESKSINLTTVSSEINTDYIHTERISVSSVSGKIKMNEVDAESLIIDTISGDVDVKKMDGKIKTSSITGNIMVNNEECGNLKKFVKGVFGK